jgi:hypothetical protein
VLQAGVEVRPEPRIQEGQERTARKRRRQAQRGEQGAGQRRAGGGREVDEAERYTIYAAARSMRSAIGADVADGP